MQKLVVLLILLVAVVLAGAGFGHSAAETPGETVIAFASDGNGSWDIYTMNPDGSDVQQITDDPDVDFFESAWSPDGSQLALASNQGLWVVNADGSDLQAYSPSGLINGVDWSPDGSKIVYGKSDIFTIGSDGSDWHNLTNDHGFHGYYNASPAWSPDGTKIAYHSRRENPDGGDIYVINADGSGKELLAGLSGQTDDNPDWSPDGATVTFDSESEKGRQIYVVNADGSDQRQLTDGPSEHFDAAWAPDGSRMAASCTSEGPVDICILNGDGSMVGNVTNSAADDQYPAWGGQAGPEPVMEKVFMPVVLGDWP